MFEILEHLPYRKFLEIFTPEYPRSFQLYYWKIVYYSAVDHTRSSLLYYGKILEFSLLVVLLENSRLFCISLLKVFTVV